MFQEGNTPCFERSPFEQPSVGDPESYFREDFFRESWPRLLITVERPIDLSGIENPQKRAKAMYDSLMPSLDTYIEKYDLPVIKRGEETDAQFFTRVCDAMYTLNTRNEANKGWRDCWPSTAFKIGRTNCALGSLVLARALEMAGYNREELEFGMPGPMSHAVIIAKGRYYIDPANGVVLNVRQGEIIDDIKTYEVIETADIQVMDKVPFRLIPVCTVEQGIAPLIWNIGSMLSENDEIANDLATQFGVNKEHPYTSWAKESLLGESWGLKRFQSQSAWIKEGRESEERLRQ